VGTAQEVGRALVYTGSSSGLSSSPQWTGSGSQESEEYGDAVASAGDVNGDGFSDVLVGALGYSIGAPLRGKAWLYALALARWASRGRQDLLDLLDQLTPKIQDLTRALEEEVEKRPVTRRLMTHPGVGPLTALAFELVIGTPERFHCGKQIASYVGLVPSEESSGDRRRLGLISKQGNSLLRFLLVEAPQVTVRSQSQWRSKFFHLALRRGRKIAKVAMARGLAVRLYWMWRKGWDYEQWKRFGPHAGQPGTGVGVKSITE
jgi:hypothetical protein